MKKVLKISTVFIMILIMGCVYAYANEGAPQTNDTPLYMQGNDYPVYEPSPGLKVVDAVFVRPTMVGASMLTTAAFIVISPTVYVMGIGTPMANAMVQTPWRFTVARPLGDFTGRTFDGQPIHKQAAW